MSALFVGERTEGYLRATGKPLGSFGGNGRSP
nr:MAG TPA: hypothetical protein [Caudoviricetes sp.]